MFFKYNYFSTFFFSLILVGTLVPGSTLPESSTQHLDKVIHALLFFLFVFSAIIGFVKQSQYPKLHFDAVKYVLLFSGLLAIGTEVLQYLVIPRRTFDLYDIVADVFGVGVGFLFFLLVRGDKKCGF